MSPKMWLALLAFALQSPAASAATFQTLTDYLGVPSADGIFVNALSAEGSVFVGSRLVQTVPAAEYEAIYWTRQEGLISFPRPLRALQDVSADGTNFIAWDDNFDTYLASTSGAIVPIPPQSGAEAISANGVLAVGGVGGYPPVPNAGQPMRWTANGGIEALGFLPGAGALGPTRQSGDAWDVSADGSTVVGSSNSLYQDSAACQTPCFLRQAFRWTETTGMQALGPGEAHFVSWDGNVVAGIGGPLGPAFVNRTFRWTPETGTVILDLPPGRRASVANAMNANGSIIVGMLDDGVNADAFVWDAQHGMRELQQVLIDEYGLESELAGWHLLYALEMSADGNVILGVGFDPAGVGQRFVAVLNAVPEPSTMLLGLLATLALAALARRRSA